MRTLNFSSKVFIPLFAAQLASCSEPSSPVANRPKSEITQTKTDTVLAPHAALKSYTWSAATTGSLPRLKTMMSWYLTQADNIRQLDFLEGQDSENASDDGPAAAPQGPWSVTFEVVDAYVSVLRKSGYFSDNYLRALTAKARAKQKELAHTQPPKNTVPSIEGLPLFPRNYDDMMSSRESLLFSLDSTGNTVVLNDGFTLRRFTFDATGKIEAVSFSSVNQNPGN